jgi:hypothetical protein
MLNPIYMLLTADTDYFFGIDPSDRFPLLIVVIVFGTVLIITTVGMLSLTARSIHHRRLEAELKRDLLDRGMSAEEVARVVEASSGRGGWFNRSATRGEMR